MQEIARQFRCAESLCGFEWVDVPLCTECPKCGGTSLIQSVLATDTIKLGVLEKIRLKQKDPAFPSSKNPRRELRSGTRQEHSGRLVDERRVVDKANDLYEERVTDHLSGEVIHDTTEKLSEHRGHGSAKRKK